MTNDENTREAAVEEAARWLYNQQATRAMPAYEELDDMIQFRLKEAGLDMINTVLRFVKPVDADLEVLRMNVSLFADEIRGEIFLSGRRVAEGLDMLVRQEQFEKEDKDG